MVCCLFASVSLLTLAFGMICSRGNVERFLRQLDIAANVYNASCAARVLRMLLPLVDKYDPMYDSPDALTAERAMAWRVNVELFGPDDAFMPELSRFVELLGTHRRNAFIASQLLLLCRQLDLADIVGRNRLSSLLRQMLPDRDVPATLLPQALLLLRDVSASDDECIALVCEAVAEIREPLDFVNHGGESPDARERKRRRRQLQGHGALRVPTADTGDDSLASTSQSLADESASLRAEPSFDINVTVAVTVHR